MRPIRETLRRYTYDAQSRASQEHVDDKPRGASVNPVGMSRFKSSLRRIPILAPVFIAGYRLIKMPSRIALLLLQVENIVESLASISRQHKFAASRIQALESTLSEASRNIQVLRSRSDRQEELYNGLLESSRTLIAVQERGEQSAQKLSSQIEAVRPVINAGENLIISQVDGFIMAFPAEEWRFATYAILVGQPEPGLYSVMKETIREGMVVIDVGANVGTYTLLALRQIGSRGMVLSYEPTPRAFDILKNNVQVNAFLESGRVDLRRKAVSDSTQANTTFFVSKKCLGHSSLYADDKLSSNEVETIEIETVSLDDDVGVHGEVDVVKIDAEGAEPAILRGMRQIINNNPEITIFIEFAPQHLVRANVDPRSYLEQIRNQGFEIFEVKEPTGELVPATDQALCDCFSVNLMLRKHKPT